LHPPGKPKRDDSSGEIAVQSDSVVPASAVGKQGSASESDLTMDLSSGSTPAPLAGHDETAPPTAFGRYQVGRAVGAGGFGAVYLGHDTQLDRPVAIKVLRGGPDVPQAGAEQFLQEARRLAQLSHPGIVAVHDVGFDGGQAYIVSDFLEGPTLDRWLGAHHPDWPEAARIAAALADALSHAHARLVVHRDIKPANIILTADRGPVLVDFGLGLDEAGAGGSKLGVISGTPAYMAPEQVAGVAHRIDGRTDIYSLGVVLYEMLCGRLPFRATSTRELLRQVRDDEPQPPRQLARDIPPELERACLRALAKRLQDRYTTASDFAEDLRAVGHASAGSIPMPPSRQSFDATTSAQGFALRPSSLHQSSLSQSSATRRAREAERRQVTVLVCGCDVFESETYLEDRDTEEQSEVLEAFQRTCEQALAPFDGTVVQCDEQGLLACFGYPVAHEDAARRAAHAGLGILDRMKPLSARLRVDHGLELTPWMGIHTGPAIAETGDDGVSLVGEARNVAVRLKDLAQPGQIVITAATHRLVQGHFDCASLGYRKVKGASQPVELFQVRGLGEDLNPIEIAERAGLSPLTGRDHEISLLKDRWEQAQEGMGQVVLLIGDPGLGKSRLVHTMKQLVRERGSEPIAAASGPTTRSVETPFLAARGSPVIEWRCSPQHRDTGLYPVSDFFERFLGLNRDEGHSARFERLISHLRDYDLARPDVVPLFASLLSLDPDERFPAIGLPPAREREETFQALREWVSAYSERRPVLFVVEDLHWVDASTLEFLTGFLAEGLHDRVLTVLTFRPEFQTPWPALAHQTSLALNRLTRRQVGDMIRKKAGNSIPEALVDQLHERTGGVPLFVEEFTKMVQELGLRDQEGRGLAQVSELMAREIPTTLQDLVMARLDHLEGDREVAQLAAVLGREFGYEQLAAAATADEPVLQAELAKLVHAEILYPKGRQPRCAYVFKHALLQDALYNALVKSRRQHFHQRIAEAMETQFPQSSESQPELLGHHYTEAGLFDKAVGYWLKAGLRSRDRAAYREAIGHLTRALALLDTLEETPRHDEQRLTALTTLGPAYIAACGYAAPEVGPVLLRAGELCRRFGDEHQQFGILLGRWEWHLVRGDIRPCVGLAAEGVALAERLSDPGMLMEAWFMPGATGFYRARFAESRAWHEKALASYDDRDRTKLWSAHSGHDSGVTHRCYLALDLWHLGYPDQALGLDHETRELARTIGHAFSLGHALDFTAFLSLYCRLGSQAVAAAEEEKVIGTEQGFQLWHALGILHTGAGMLAQGRLEEALLLLEKGFGAFRATGAEVRVPSYLAILGEAFTQCGRFADARQALDEGLSVAEVNDDRSHEAELHRLRGELWLAESPDQVSDAEKCFRRAIETARSQQSRAWELRATMSLARLWQRQGRRAEAQAALAAVYNAYKEGFATPDLVEAAARLKSLA
jgi:serine/threonine protein kinase/predicted ATPase/energy-coupling factor transporter ATP-binding protein EcfA2